MKTLRMVCIAALSGWLVHGRAQDLTSSGSEVEWTAAVAQVKTKPELGRLPGTAFAVARDDYVVYFVTSAHVVEGDPAPVLVLRGATPLISHVGAIEAQERHGLALLSVEDRLGSNDVRFPPRKSEYTCLTEGRTQKFIGDTVEVAGFPVSVGSFRKIEAQIKTRRGRDLVLNRATGEGFSGGPVIWHNKVVGLIWGHGKDEGMAVNAAHIRDFLEGNGIRWEPHPALTPYLLPPNLERMIGTWTNAKPGSWPQFLLVKRLNPIGIAVGRCAEISDCDRNAEEWTATEDTLSQIDDRYDYFRQNNISWANEKLKLSYAAESNPGGLSTGHNLFTRIKADEH